MAVTVVARSSEEEVTCQDNFSVFAPFFFFIFCPYLVESASFLGACVSVFFSYFYLRTLVQGSLPQGWNFCVDGKIKLHEKMNSCSHAIPHVPIAGCKWKKQLPASLIAFLSFG